MGGQARDPSSFTWPTTVDAVRWFHEKLNFVGGLEAMDVTASAGRVHIMEWLHASRSDGCTVEAMNRAAQNGHVEAVASLHQHRCEWGATHALQCAIASRWSSICLTMATCSFVITRLLNEERVTDDTVVLLIDYAQSH